ncbi:MAG TPA: hypothetical protein VJT71_11615 [Pyrinomonadaceae bacterium]|nr:hypothetical protein [Pyrinomonadaceae bacterium]
MRRLSLLFLLGLFLPASALGQPTDVKKTAAVVDSKVKAEKDPEAERIIRERRDSARSLLISLAADAATYTDLRLRARTMSRIADALWDADPERARMMFRKAWDAAEQMDAVSRRVTLEEIKSEQAKSGSAVAANRNSIRQEVLRLVARRDRKLGEEFLAKLTAAKEQEATEAADRNRSGLFDTPEAITQRLNLARQLLGTDVERAIQFADPALTTLTQDSIDFLSYLRDKDANAADQRYAALLGRTAGNMQSDANSVSLLSSYLFTPHIYVAFTTDGGANTSSTGRPSPAPDVAPELRAAFFRAATDILLRPLAAPGQDQTSTGVVGKYLMLKRLLPLFELYAPREMTESVRAHMDALANAVADDVRQKDDYALREGIRPREKTEDQEKSLLDRIERAKTAEERDQLYGELARILSEAGDVRARDFADKISDSEVRKMTRAFIDATLLLNAVDKKDADRAIELLRTGELTLIQKTWGLAQAARLLAKTDAERARALLEQADTEARRIEPSNADRARGLLAVANTYLEIDQQKAWDETDDAIKAANSAEGFTGEDGMLRISLFTKGSSSIRSGSAREFDLAPTFSRLAAEDYNRTIELARLFERQAPRASATIAIARAVLEEKKK